MGRVTFDAMQVGDRVIQGIVKPCADEIGGGLEKNQLFFRRLGDRLYKKKRGV